MVVNNPHKLKRGDRVKPRYNKDKFLEMWLELDKTRHILTISSFYDKLIGGEYKVKFMDIDIFVDDNEPLLILVYKSSSSIYIPEKLLRKW